MSRSRPVPEYMDSLGEFLNALRSPLFRSQVSAASYFHADRSTITRYENGRSRPPIGFIAHLVFLFFEGQDSDPAIQDELLKETNRAIRWHYEFERPFGDWQSLVAIGDAYINEQRVKATVETRSRTNALKSPQHRLEYWGTSPDIEQFCGREDEIGILHEWIADEGCRVVAVLGMAGIGKSMLAKRAVSGCCNQFEHVIWHSLLSEPPVEETVAHFLRLLSGDNEVDLSQNLGQLTAQLIGQLQEHRCLLVVDNVDSIMQRGASRAGEYQSGHEAYSRLFQTVADTAHQSCLLITSREKPPEIAYHEGEYGRVRSLQLEGVDTAVAREVLGVKELVGIDAHWRQLVERLSGNLLILNMVSSTIIELYSGEIAQFNEHVGSPIISDARYFLDEQYARLSELEQELLYWFVIEQEPALPARLHENLHPTPPINDVLTAIESLRRRSLIKRTGIAGFVPHEVVFEYVAARLAEEVFEDIRDGDLDLINRFSLMKAQSKDHVRQGQMRLFLGPAAERLVAAFGRQSLLEAHLDSLVAELRGWTLSRQGYAGGNIFNMLVHLNADLRHRDFSGLRVWQALLVGAEFHDLNLADADLSRSVFTEVFDSACSLAFSTDGAMLVAGTNGNHIRVWRIDEQRQMMTLNGHTDWVRRVVYGNEDEYLYSCSDDETVRQWDMATGQCVRTFGGHVGRVLGLAVNDAGSILASGGEDKSIRLWDSQTGRLLRVLEGHEKWVWSLAFCPERNLLASSSSDGTVKLWHASTGRCLHTLVGHTSYVWDVAFCPDGTKLASCGHDRAVRIWDAETGECLRTFDGLPGQAKCVTFSPDGRLVACGTLAQTIHLWLTESGDGIGTLHGQAGNIWSLAFSPDGRTLVSSSDYRTIRIWDTAGLRVVNTLYGRTQAIRSLAVVPGGPSLASAGEEGIIRIWNPQTGEQTGMIRGHRNVIRSIAISADGRFLASGGGDNMVQVWDLSLHERVVTLKGHSRWIHTVAISTDSRLVASGGVDLTVRVWDIHTGEILKVLQEGNDEINSLAFNRNSHLLAGGSEDSKIWIWDLESESLVTSLEGHVGPVWAVKFLPDRNTLISAGRDGSICIWNVDSTKLTRRIDAHEDLITALAVDPNGTVIASGSRNGSVRLWDAETGAHLATLTGHTGSVFSLCFLPDSDLLASGSQDETIRLWSVTTYTAIRTMRADRIYERMNVSGISGVTRPVLKSMLSLGAVG